MKQNETFWKAEHARKNKPLMMHYATSNGIGHFEHKGGKNRTEEKQM